jgi:hypothetical protein
LAAGRQAVEVDDPLRPPTLAASSAEVIQVADGLSKVISGQAIKLLTTNLKQNTVAPFSKSLYRNDLDIPGSVLTQPNSYLSWPLDLNALPSPAAI